MRVLVKQTKWVDSLMVPVSFSCCLRSANKCSSGHSNHISSLDVYNKYTWTYFIKNNPNNYLSSSNLRRYLRKSKPFKLDV